MREKASMSGYSLTRHLNAYPAFAWKSYFTRLLSSNAYQKNFASEFVYTDVLIMYLRITYSLVNIMVYSSSFTVKRYWSSG